MTAVPSPCATGAHERFVTRHVARISKEEERTRDKRYVEDVITRSAEHLFGEDDRESRCNRYLPQRGVNRHDKRDDESRHEETLGYLFVLDLRHGELDTQTDDVTYQDIRQYSQEAEAERFPPESGGHAGCQLAGGEQVLVTYVEHTEEQRGNQSQYDNNHRTLAVRTVMDMRAKTLGGCLRREEEGIESVVERTEPVQLAAFLEVLAELLPIFI